MRSMLLALLLLAIPATATAAPVTIEGITFSDEEGGFTILGASGSGSYDDPFVVIEELTDPEGAVLLMRGAVA